MRLPVLLFLPMLLVACYKAPPPGPLPPTPPPGLAAFDKTIELPPPQMAEAAQVFAVPTDLPLDPSETVVLAIPTMAKASGDKGAGQTGLDPKSNAIRVGLISAFLDAGYRVKDAGELTVPRMHIRSNPEYVGKSTPVPPPPLSGSFGGTPGGDDAKPDDKEAWRGYDIKDGLTLDLNDPTSLWAPELTDYPDLGARYFFRVFEIDVFEQQRGTSGRRYYSESQMEQFEVRASGVNAELREWTKRREALVGAEIRYIEEHAEFRTACRAWESQWASNIRAKGVRTNCGTAAESVPIPEAPEPFSRKTLQEYLANSAGQSTTRVVGRILAELIDTRNGEVVWVGRAEVEVDPGPDATARLFSKMLQKLRGF